MKSPDAKRLLRTLGLQLARVLPARFLSSRLQLSVRHAIPSLSSTIRLDLDRANQQLETIFLQLGNQFIPLHGKVADLLKSCDQLIGLASGQREGQTLFQEAVQALHPPLDYISFCVDKQQRLIGLLGRCEQHTGEMLGVQKQMHDMLAPLTYIEVLFKIESASLDHEHRDTFLTVVAEIARLRSLVNETFSGNTELLAKTHRMLGEVRRQLEDDFRDHSEQVAEKRRQIESAINSLDSQLTRDRQQDLELQRVSRELSAQVDTIVAGIQRQDIIKQKCEHVIAALASFEINGPSPAHFVQLQLKQLQSVDEELGEAISSTDRSIDEIERQAADVDKQCLALVEFEGMTASADGMVQMLLDALSGVHEIVRRTLALAETSLEATRPAGSIASDLSTTLGELSINMRLIALNAQVRSLQIDSGTGLEILAARTAALSGDIADTSRQVAEDLLKLKGAADEMFGILGEFISRGRTQVAVIDGAQGQTERRLHEMRDRTLSVMTEVGATVGAVRESAKIARSTLETAPEARKGIMLAHGRLADFIVRHKLDHRAKLEADAAAEFMKHAKGYTMASEREIHEAVANGREHTPTVRPEESTTELFTGEPEFAAPPPPPPPKTTLRSKLPPSATQAPSAPPRATAVRAPAPVQPVARPAPPAPEPRPAPTPPPAPAAPKPTADQPSAPSSGFGDNVDLF